MSIRQVCFLLRHRRIAGFLITDQPQEPERTWFLEADAPADAVVELSYSEVIDLRIEYHDGASSGSGVVEEVHLAPEGGKLRITGKGPLDPWPSD